MKKFIGLILFLFILTGCTVEYDLVIDEDSFEELIVISENNSANWNKVCEKEGSATYKESIQWLRDFPITVYKNAAMDPYDPYVTFDDVDYYSKNVISDGETYGIKMTASGSIKDLSNIRSIDSCYDIGKIINNDDEYIISTSFNNYCFEDYPLLEEFTINIKTNMKVTFNNADSINGNTYTWKITKDNYDDKSISLAMQSIQDYKNDKALEEEERKGQAQKRKMEKQKQVTIKTLGIIGIVFLIVAMILVIAILIKNRRENKI